MYVDGSGNLCYHSVTINEIFLNWHIDHKNQTYDSLWNFDIDTGIETNINRKQDWI